MGALEHHYKTADKYEKAFLSGKIDKDQAQILVSLLSQKERALKDFIGVHISAMKHGKKLLNRLVRANVIGDGTAIEIEHDIETEMVKCPEKDGSFISRASCLDYSGGHLEECNGCENGVVTKKLLLP